MDIDFYHVTKGSLYDAAALLSEKVFQAGMRAVVTLSNVEEVEEFDHKLWTYKQKSFVPHGNQKSGYAEHQPIWLTDFQENPNGAEVLINVGLSPESEFGSFKRILDIFNGFDEDAVSKARARWKVYKTRGANLNYWRQVQGSGKWEKMEL